MNEESKKPPGRPRISTTPRQTLGSVRVDDDQLKAYKDAAEVKGLTRADWVRKTLDNAAKRVLK